MRVSFKVVGGLEPDVGPHDCDHRKALEGGSLSAISAAFPDCECYVWHIGRWLFIDHSTSALVVDGSRLLVDQKTGERSSTI